METEREMGTEKSESSEQTEEDRADCKRKSDSQTGSKLERESEAQGRSGLRCC